MIDFQGGSSNLVICLGEHLGILLIHISNRGPSQGVIGDKLEPLYKSEH